MPAFSDKITHNYFRDFFFAIDLELSLSMKISASFNYFLFQNLRIIIVHLITSYMAQQRHKTIFEH